MSSSRKKKPRKGLQCAYTVLDELMASATEPLPIEKRTYQLTRMYQGLHEMEQGKEPTPEDWRLVADAVNLMETMIRDMKICEDESGLLQDAIEGLTRAGKRQRCGGPLRLDGEGIKAVRSVLEDYASLIETLPARVMVRCHRITEKRLIDLMNGKRRSHDEVIEA
jgi:hypothetical protein